MDNHRAATWCWLQHVDASHPHSLLHIDRHYDCASSREEEVNCLSSLKDRSINEYLHLSYNDGPGAPLRVFRWDNYLSIYLAGYANSIKQLRLCTHNVDHKPQRYFEPGNLWDIPRQIGAWLDPEAAPWIFNLDLDYFFWSAIECGQPGLMVSDNYLTASLKNIRQKIEDRTIAVTTIALTPSLTSGWAPAEQLAKRILGILGFDFELPNGGG